MLQLIIDILNHKFDGLSEIPPSKAREFIETCESEGVSALVRQSLLKGKFTGNLLPEISARLDQFHARQAVVNLVRTQDNRRVFDGLSQHHIDFIILKGEALAWTLYPEPHLRTRLDTDILFRNKQQAEEAFGILSKLGYRKGFALEGELVGLQFECSKDLQGGITNFLDVHNRLCNSLWIGNKFTFDELAQNTLKIDYQGLQVEILNRPYALLHNCLHRLSNKRSGEEDKLIWRYDMHLLNEAMSREDWETFCQIAEQKEVAALCLEGLTRAEDAFPGTLPSFAKHCLVQISQTEPEPPSNLDKSWGGYLLNLQSQKSIRGKICYVWENLFPPASYIRERYKPSRRALVPYYYLKRLLDFLRK